MLLDLAPFDTELVEVEILDMATLLDAAGEQETEDPASMLLVDGGTNVLDVTDVLALKDAAL